jgi:hypothetical protein
MEQDHLYSAWYHIQYSAAVPPKMKSNMSLRANHIMLFSTLSQLSCSFITMQGGNKYK